MPPGQPQPVETSWLNPVRPPRGPVEASGLKLGYRDGLCNRQEAAWYPTQPGLAYFDTQAREESDSSATSSDSGTEQLPDPAVQGMTPDEAEQH